MTFMSFFGKESSKFIFLIFHQGCIQHQISFVFYQPLFCPNQLGQELPEGLQKYLGKSHACDWECCQMVLPVDPEGHSVQSSHLYQVICSCVQRRGLFTHLMGLMVKSWDRGSQKLYQTDQFPCLSC